MASQMVLEHHAPERTLAFPASDPEWELPEGNRHALLCELIAHLLRLAVEPQGSVGADQFVYFDASNPRRCLAPDAFVKLDVPAEFLGSWKTWERGTPELCIEILSPSDTQEKLSFADKLARYEALGTRELVVFDFDAAAGRRLRAWDRRNDQWVERVVSSDRTPCLTLGMHFVIAPADGLPEALRLSTDPEGHALLPTRAERAEARADQAEARADQAEARADQAEARAAAAERELASLRAQSRRS